MRKILSTIMMSAMLVSCGDFEEVNTNPDAATTVVYG